MFRRKADEAIELALRTKDLEAREGILNVAWSYIKLAERLEAAIIEAEQSTA